MPFQELPARLADVREVVARAQSRGGHAREVTIIAVTKTYGPEAPLAAWDAGLRDVGENRLQEATRKMARIDVPLRWHLVGHLQRNKVKQVDGFDLIHSLDGPRLGDVLAEHGETRQRPVHVLMQVNVSGEGTKGGYAQADVGREAVRLLGKPWLRVRGVMTIAPLDADEGTLRQVFSGARRCRDELRAAGHDAATELSMGMSGDYEIAVEEGATLVRLGTVLFGARAT